MYHYVDGEKVKMNFASLTKFINDSDSSRYLVLGSIAVLVLVIVLGGKKHEKEEDD